jgi:hypothetical protein
VRICGQAVIGNVQSGTAGEGHPHARFSFLILLKVVRLAQFAVSTDAPLHVSDDGLAPLIHMDVLDTVGSFSLTSNAIPIRSL